MGIYLVTFFSCLRVLLHPEDRFKRLRDINFKMLIAALLMFTFASLDVAFGLRHNLDAFVAYDGDPIEEFEKISYWVNVMKMGCYVAQTFVGDAILLYRLWVVYNQKYYVVVFPVLIWLAETVCGAMIIYVEATLTNNHALLNSSQLSPFITSMLTLTLAMNLITTSLIVYRIRSIRSALSGRSIVLGGSFLENYLRIFIESGTMYTASIIILFGTYLASNNSQLGVSDAVVQIIGITFNLIIIRVDRERTSQQLPSNTYRSQHSQGPIQSRNAMPLHMINIQTTVSRYPDPPLGAPAKVGSIDTDTDVERGDAKPEAH
ncbi:hypothetical protein AX16_004334 [Volvariella volvacea WC 439]|nr:hypothetical protein AX16_004334 [Volvariella volvacea WC 439]